MKGRYVGGLLAQKMGGRGLKDVLSTIYKVLDQSTGHDRWLPDYTGRCLVDLCNICVYQYMSGLKICELLCDRL